MNRWLTYISHRTQSIKIYIEFFEFISKPSASNAVAALHIFHYFITDSFYFFLVGVYLLQTKLLKIKFCIRQKNEGILYTINLYYEMFFKKTYFV